MEQTLPLMDPDTVHRSRLANGLTLLVRRDRSAPVVAIVTLVNAGYFDETDDVVGIAHVLEHMYFKGTPSRGVGEISRQTKAAGGYLNAGTIYDHTRYYAVLPASSFVRGLEIQADAYTDSLIDEHELARELEVIIQEAKRKADNPAAVTNETLFELLHDRHRMRRWRIGREEGLRRMTRDHVAGFYRNFYRPSNTVLSIVGDIDPDDALVQVERCYGHLPDAPVERIPGPEEDDWKGFRYRELEGDVMQTHIALGWRTPGTLHADTPMLDLAAAVLGTGRASRLYRAVRERQLAASVTAYNYTPTDTGVFVMHLEGQPDTALPAASAAWEQLRILCDEGVGRDELWRARRLFEARWVRRLETMDGQANYLADWEALGDWMHGERYLKRLLLAEAEQVRDAMQRWLSLDRAAVVLYRPRSAPAAAKDQDAARRALERAHSEPLPVPPPRTPAAPAVHDGSPKLEREVGPVRVYRGRAGVPLLVRRKEMGPMAAFGAYFEGGPREEPTAHAGLTAMLARTAVKGTTRRTAEQISEDAELLGGSVSGSAYADGFGWSISVPASSGGAALELLADVVQNATIPADALDTERAVALSDLAQLRDDMYRFPLRLLAQAAYAGHAYGTPASGTEESLTRLTTDDVRAWHEARVLEAPMVLAAVGPDEPDDLARSLDRAFSRLRIADARAAERPEWPSESVTTVETRDKAQTALALAFPAPSSADEARFVTRLIAGVASGLGGRFFEELRDRRSLAYTVNAATSERRYGGMFVSYIATSPEREEEARAGLLAEFARLREEPVTDEELSRAQEYAIGTHAIHQQTAGALLGDMVDAWLDGAGLDELEKHDSRVRAVSTSAMLELARRCFDPARLVQGIVRGSGGQPV